MFVDLQGFVIDKRFIVKEVAVRRGTILIHYIFSHIMAFSDKIRQILRFLVEYLSS